MSATVPLAGKNIAAVVHTYVICLQNSHLSGSCPLLRFQTIQNVLDNVIERTFRCQLLRLTKLVLYFLSMKQAEYHSFGMAQYSLRNSANILLIKIVTFSIGRHVV